MIDKWPGLLLPLWIAILFEPLKPNKKVVEKPPKVIKVDETNKTDIDSTLLLKITDE